MIFVEKFVDAIKGFDLGSAVDAEDFGVAADVLWRVAGAFAARMSDDWGTEALRCSETPGLPDANHVVPTVLVKSDRGMGSPMWVLFIGRVAAASRNRSPDDEWCIGYDTSGTVLHVPKIIPDDLLCSLAERLASAYRNEPR